MSDPSDHDRRDRSGDPLGDRRDRLREATGEAGPRAGTASEDQATDGLPPEVADELQRLGEPPVDPRELQAARRLAAEVEPGPRLVTREPVRAVPFDPRADATGTDRATAVAEHEPTGTGEAGEAGEASEAGKAGEASEAGKAGEASEAGKAGEAGEAGEGGKAAAAATAAEVEALAGLARAVRSGAGCGAQTRAGPGAAERAAEAVTGRVLAGLFDEAARDGPGDPTGGQNGPTHELEQRRATLLGDQVDRLVAGFPVAEPEGGTGTRTAEAVEADEADAPAGPGAPTGPATPAGPATPVGPSTPAGSTAPSEITELTQVAAMIRAASHAQRLSAARLHALVEAAVSGQHDPSAQWADEQAAPAAAREPEPAAARPEGPAKGLSAPAGRPRYRGSRVLAVALAASLAVAGIVGLVLRFGGSPAPADDVPQHLLSRSTRDILPGAFPRSQSASERIDLIYHDRLRAYRQIQLRGADGGPVATGARASARPSVPSTPSPPAALGLRLGLGLGGGAP